MFNSFPALYIWLLNWQKPISDDPFDLEDGEYGRKGKQKWATQFVRGGKKYFHPLPFHSALYPLFNFFFGGGLSFMQSMQQENSLAHDK